MLKLMIIDDEHLVRNLFKRCLNWQEIGFSITGEAAGAREALELIETEIPDIIFTDICMPHMDGLELSQIIREKYPWVKIVILTGHEEFEYAKRSIQVGVTDFILKPIHDLEIKKVVLSLKDKILKERAEREEYQRLKQQLTDNLPYLKEKFFNELLQNKTFDADVKEKLKYFRIDFGLCPFHVAVIEISPCLPTDNTDPEKQLMLAIQGMTLITEYYGKRPHIYIFFDYQQRIVVLNNNSEIETVALLESIKLLLQKELHSCVTVGIGQSYPNPERIHYSYREALDALNYKLLVGKDQIISYNDLNLTPQKTPSTNCQNEELSFFIRAGCCEKALDWLEHFFGGISNDPTFTIDSLRAKAFMVLATTLNTIDAMGLKTGDIFPDDIRPYDRIFQNDTLPEMKDYLKDLVSTVTIAVKNLQDKKEGSITTEVQEYLLKNLADSDLSLTKVAQEFYLNSSYLSRIFKQATGATFVEFLTKIRMEKAIKLLRETDQKAYQIGEAVGIPDPHYFGVCFKKYTGMSVNEFRKT